MSEKKPESAVQAAIAASDPGDCKEAVSVMTVLTHDLTPMPGQEVLKGKIGVLDCGLVPLDTSRRAQEVADNGLVDIGVGQEQPYPWPSWPNWPEDALVPHPVSGRMVHPDEVHPTPLQRRSLADWLKVFMKKRADAAGMSVKDWIKNGWQKDESAAGPND